ncbi:unnamed protein product [Cochlearia groenlandica]
MLDTLPGGYGHGYGHKDHRSSGYGFEDHKQFASHDETQSGYYNRQSNYNPNMRLPGTHSRPPMTHMPRCDEEDSDSDMESELFRGHGNQHHSGAGHMMPHQGAHGMQHGPHGMQHGSAHGAAYGPHGMQHGAAYGPHGMQHGGAHGMQHGAHGMQHGGAHGMQHGNRLMAPNAPPHNVYVSGGGHLKAKWGNKGL